MRRIAAQYLFTGTGALLRHGMVTLNGDQQIVETGIWDGQETEGLEFYNGILSPGFINAHCHLELSHLQGSVAPQAGMTGFLKSMMNRSMEVAGTASQQNADKQMKQAGIVAAGDICNTSHSFEVKRRSTIYYHSFIEVAGLPEQVTEYRKTMATELLATAKQAGLTATVTPHAPYSLNNDLFAYAVETAQKQGILSIHNQESEEENELFLHRDGILRAFFASGGFDAPCATGCTAVHRLLPLLHHAARVLLVHNTVTSEADYEAVTARSRNVSWILCPNSNRYISGKLPPALMFYYKGAPVAIGTDSLASNSKLSVLEELKTLALYFPQIPVETLLQWATLGGAQALRKEQELGSIEPGKRPGLVLIENIDLQCPKLTAETTVRPLTG